MKRNTLWVLALALATGLIAAGCGGDDDDDDGGGGGDALTKEEFLAQGNQICEEGNAEIGEAAAAVGQNPDPAAIEEFATNTLIPSIQGQIDELRDGIPEGDEDQVNGILDDAQAALDEVEADPSLVTSSDDPFTEVNQQLSDYGLTACASG